jgi:hypothetical protein
MKRFPFAMLLFCAALFLVSCNSNDSTEKTTDTKTGDSTGTTTPVAAEVNTIVTTPQNMISVVHKVANFAKWQVSYEAHDSMKLANGLHNYVVGRGFNDSNMVLVAMKADDMAKAKAFAKDPSLKKAMQQSGVTGTPTMSFFTAVWQDTSMLAPGTLRSRTTFSVKDWDAWFKNFQEGKQERMDNGISDRVIGHEADDNKKVTLVTAVLDTAKAFAYYKSDLLKKRREAGGVIGEPQRFLFHVVKRY